MEDRINLPVTLRDRFILAQSLVMGIEKLGEVKPPHQEISNMQDMADMAIRPELTPFTMTILWGHPLFNPSPYPTASNFIHHAMEPLDEANPDP